MPQDALSELKNACRHQPSRTDPETIARGQSTSFRGRAAHAPDGTIALALSDEAKVIIAERDVRAVMKEDDVYTVELSADANFLVRVEKVMKATVQSHGNGEDHGARRTETQQGKKDGGTIIDIDTVEVCDVVCGDVVIWPGAPPVHLCVPVNCKTSKA